MLYLFSARLGVSLEISEDVSFQRTKIILPYELEKRKQTISDRRTVILNNLHKHIIKYQYT